MAGLFYMLRGLPDGNFKKAEVLTGTDGEPLIIPIEDKKHQTQNICTRPFAVDWDGDGQLDLVVGNFAGTFYLFRGEGDGQFLPEPEQLTTGGEPLKLANRVIKNGMRTTARMGHHSDPFVIDWDGDGDLDILSGTSIGGVQCAENRAGPEEPPRLEPFRWLVEPVPQVEYGALLNEEELTGPVDDTRVWAEDVNGDGKLDLLVGDRVTLVSPAEGLSEDEYKQKFADWQKARKELTAELSSLRDDKKRRELYQRFSKVYNQRHEFMNENRTGFVWLYLQK